jgi:hypothetical protein
VIQLPDKPFGLSWYQGDILTNSTGIGVGDFVGRFSRETFIVAAGVGPAPEEFPAPPEYLGLSLRSAPALCIPRQEASLAGWGQRRVLGGGRRGKLGQLIVGDQRKYRVLVGRIKRWYSAKQAG